MRKSAEERVSQALKVSLRVVIAHSPMPGRSKSCSSRRNAVLKGASVLDCASRSQKIAQDTRLSSFGSSAIWKHASVVLKEVGGGENSRQVARSTSSKPR